jgi:hypothetical protein
MLASICFWATWLTLCFPATEKSAKRAQRASVWPLWQLDVRALGYAPWSVRESFDPGTGIGQICLPSDDQIIVTFVSRIVPGTLPRRNQPDVSSTLLLQALFIDTGTGRVRARREWPTASEKSRIAPAGDGRFVVITPDRLMLYSPELQALKEIGISIGHEAIYNQWNLRSSPAGGYLKFEYSPVNDKGVSQTSTGKWELIDTKSLQVVWRDTDPGYGGIHIGSPLDDGEVLARNGTGGAALVGKPGGPWRPYSDPRWDPGCRPTDTWLVSNEAIFGADPLSLDRWCYTVGLKTGEVLFAENFANKEIVRWLASSACSQRFALAVDRGKGGSWALDLGPHYSLNRIMVYDIPSRRWIFTLSGKRQGIKSISGLALSPDGSLLGLINQDGILEVYRVRDGG